MMKKLTLIILTILILALTACKSNSSSTPALGSGSVYFSVYQITAPADGKILGLILEKGDRIGQEQPLFAVDDQQLAAEIKEAATDAARTEAEIKAMQNGQNRADNTAAVAAAQQQYEQAAAQEAKMASLYKQGAIARRQYEAASAAKAAAQAALSAAQSAAIAQAAANRAQPKIVYWCEGEQGYYPQVRSCPTGWKAMPAPP